MCTTWLVGKCRLLCEDGNLIYLHAICWEDLDVLSSLLKRSCNPLLLLWEMIRAYGGMECAQMHQTITINQILNSLEKLDPRHASKAFGMMCITHDKVLLDGFGMCEIAKSSCQSGFYLYILRKWFIVTTIHVSPQFMAYFMYKNIYTTSNTCEYGKGSFILANQSN